MSLFTPDTGLFVWTLSAFIIWIFIIVFIVRWFRKNKRRRAEASAINKHDTHENYPQK